MLKACAECGVELQICEFPCSTNCRTFVNYPMKTCRSCQTLQKKTVRQLEKIFPRPPEGSLCELCGRAEKKLYLDHDHSKTGPEAFRGYLCIRCNTAACSYSIIELEQTIAYLKRRGSAPEGRGQSPHPARAKKDIQSLRHGIFYGIEAEDSLTSTDENPLLVDSDFSGP
jgi:hypothetical protein